jgi:hypothetical protein
MTKFKFAPREIKTKEELHLLAFYAYLQYLHEGFEVTICKLGVARGASFSRNQHPFNGLRGVEKPSIYA